MTLESLSSWSAAEKGTAHSKGVRPFHPPLLVPAAAQAKARRPPPALAEHLRHATGHKAPAATPENMISFVFRRPRSRLTEFRRVESFARWARRSIGEAAELDHAPRLAKKRRLQRLDELRSTRVRRARWHREKIAAAPRGF